MTEEQNTPQVVIGIDPASDNGMTVAVVAATMAGTAEFYWPGVNDGTTWGDVALAGAALVLSAFSEPPSSK